MALKFKKPKFKKPIVVGNQDDYSYRVSASWLGAETISSFNITTDGNASIGASSESSGTITGRFTGVTSGVDQVHFDWTTSGGRTDCVTCLLVVRDNC